MTASIIALLAHQGGWDEILLVAGPIAVIVGLLAIVKKRLDRATELRNRQVDPLDQGTDRD
jgi:sugar phosphate permease